MNCFGRNLDAAKSILFCRLYSVSIDVLESVVRGGSEMVLDCSGCSRYSDTFSDAPQKTVEEIEQRQ